MDGSRFDALTKALAESGSRRRALGGFLAGALALLGGLQTEEVAAKKCNQKDKKKRKRCKKKNKGNTTPSPLSPPPGTTAPMPVPCPNCLGFSTCHANGRCCIDNYNYCGQDAFGCRACCSGHGYFAGYTNFGIPPLPMYNCLP